MGHLRIEFSSRNSWRISAFIPVLPDIWHTVRNEEGCQKTMQFRLGSLMISSPSVIGVSRKAPFSEHSPGNLAEIWSHDFSHGRLALFQSLRHNSESSLVQSINTTELKWWS
jgi:hypothetical protein